MKGRFGSLSLLLVFALLAGTGALRAQQTQQAGYSHVRIVRLSFVDGTVLVKRPGAAEWAKASVNTPIEQGFSVSTSENSFAEVQFENGSTARIGQLSRLNFTELALNPKGDKINRLTFAQGYGTFHLTPQHGDVYAVAAANSVITPHGKAEFRADLDQGRLRVQVFSGAVEVKDPKQTAKLTKDKSLEYNTQTLTAFDINHGIEKDAWDNWVQKRDSQAALAYNDSPVGTSSALSGWNDLDEYGEWGFFPGYGYGWAPFAQMGWTPFSMGQWSWYPTFGYTWISSEPWGWLPYHYGAWNYNPGFGYFWTPGNMSVWNPALVAWYGGAGYVGWAALGPNGTPVCSTTACVTAVRAGTLQNGIPVDTNTRVHLNQAQLTHVLAPNLAPRALAMLPGVPVNRNTIIPGASGALRVLAANTIRPATRPAATSFVKANAAPATAMSARNTAAPRMATSSAVRAVAAPKIVLMGQSPKQTAAQMRAPVHQSFFSRAFGSGNSSRPMRARLGNTLGGHYSAFTRTGTSAFHAVTAPVQLGREGGVNTRLSAGSSIMRSNPVFLGHRGGSFSQPAFRLEGGSIHAVSRGSVAAPGGFGGVGGAPSGMSAVGPASAPASSPAPMGGGMGHAGGGAGHAAAGGGHR